MQSVKSKFGILIALLLCVTVIGTCTLVQHPTDTSPHPNQDTAIVNQWKKEKAELQVKYEKQIVTLQSQKDSLQNIANEKKKILAAYQYKTSVLQNQLKEAIVKADSNCVSADSLMPLANVYFNAEAQSDSACNNAIRALEQVAAKRDSSIIIHRQIENNLRDLKKEQELRVQYLTDQLNTAYKVQKRKSIQNKFLASGLVFIAGFTTTLLITQTLK